MPEITIPTEARTSGFLDDRLSGLSGLLGFAKGATVFDVGMNRGLIAFEFGRHGAALVHGCDAYRPGVETAREIFKELDIHSRFEVVDLSRGTGGLERAFGTDYQPRYDIVLFLGVYQHLRDQMPLEDLKQLVRHLGQRTARFFACRTTFLAEVEESIKPSEFTKVHFSSLNQIVGPCGVWKRRE